MTEFEKRFPRPKKNDPTYQILYPLWHKKFEGWLEFAKWILDIKTPFSTFHRAMEYKLFLIQNEKKELEKQCEPDSSK